MFSHSCREMPGYFFFFGGIEATKAILTGGDKAKDSKLQKRLKIEFE